MTRDTLRSGGKPLAFAQLGKGGIPDNIVLEHLRLIRGDLGDLKTDLRDVKARLASIESYIATLHGDQARTGSKLDDLVQRVERLEKRTGLIDA